MQQWMVILRERLSPVGGIDKYFLRKWLVWMQNENEVGIAKVASLKFVNEQDPTAELRPQEYAQKDEDDLMPYEIVNYIEGVFWRKCLLKDIKIKLSEDYPSYSCEKIDEFVTRFFNLWQRNQWKKDIWISLWTS